MAFTSILSRTRPSKARIHLVAGRRVRTLMRIYNTIGEPDTTIDQVDGQSLSPVTTGVPWGTQSYFWDPFKKDPKSQQWNVSVQQQFGKNLVSTVSYVGSHSTGKIGWIQGWHGLTGTVSATL